MLIEWHHLTRYLVRPISTHRLITRHLINGGFFARGSAGIVNIMSRQMFRERECIHREEGAKGDFYNGAFYLQALQRLRVDDAVRMAAKVTSFFWSDAPHIVVWLCDDCAAELRLTDTPRALTSAARRQA
jgi:hypothetical protein